VPGFRLHIVSQFEEVIYAYSYILV
jgi:hypothetical protein